MDYRVATATTAEILPLNRKSTGISRVSALERKILLQKRWQAAVTRPRSDHATRTALVEIAPDEIEGRRCSAGAAPCQRVTAVTIWSHSTESDPIANNVALKAAVVDRADASNVGEHEGVRGSCKLCRTRRRDESNVEQPNYS
jgi:hypothetical protein